MHPGISGHQCAFQVFAPCLPVVGRFAHSHKSANFTTVELFTIYLRPEPGLNAGQCCHM